MTELPLPSSADEASLAALVLAARDTAACSPSEVARLAKHLANSGQRLSWPNGDQVADIASTGGPGSLSTLLAPVVLAARGYKVVKLAVRGHPAGAIDALGTLPGYKSRLSADQVERALGQSGFAHFVADERFAPLDAALFRYRRAVGAVAVPLLAAASLLSKKVAVGVNTVGLDVRVGPHGNFGATVEEARQNARLFCEAAALLSVKAIAFLSIERPPAHPWIGRGESLVALAHTAGVRPLDRADEWLTQHKQDCEQMAYTVGDRLLADQRSWRDALADHLAAQGTDTGALEERAETVAHASRMAIVSKASGRLTIDLRVIRDGLVELQEVEGSDGYTDPAGLVLLKKPGTDVRLGEEIALLRCEGSRSEANALRSRLEVAFGCGDSPFAQQTGAVLEVVRA